MKKSKIFLIKKIEKGEKMKMKKNFRNQVTKEAVGSLENELKNQEMNDINGGVSPAVISAITAISGLSHSVTSHVSKHRKCGAYWTISKECFGRRC